MSSSHDEFQQFVVSVRLDFFAPLPRPAGWTVPDEGAAEAFAFAWSTGARCGR